MRQRRTGRQGGRGGGRERGAFLLEVLLALAVFVSAGLAILTTVERAVSSLEMVRDLRHAADLARSAIAQMEAGIAEATTLDGPVPPWQEEEGADAGVMPPQATGWTLAVETTPSPFEGLTLVTVTAERAGEVDGRATAGGVSYTLTQLVRLSGRGEEGVGAEGALNEAAREGEGTP